MAFGEGFHLPFKNRKYFTPLLLSEIAKRYFFMHQNLPSNQYAILAHWLDFTKDTAFGKHYDVASITSIRDFQQKIPVMHYDDMKPWIERCLHDETNILVPGKIEWFATSSGTTGTSKYIPVTKKSLKNNHFKAGAAGLMHYVLENPNTKIFMGQNLAIGGGFLSNPYTGRKNVGYISAILQKHTPMRAKMMKQPKANIAYLLDREHKVEKMISTTIKKNIVSIAGQPSRCSQFLEKVVEATGAQNIEEVWPQFQLVMRGGMGIELYREVFDKLFPSKKVQYYQIYNASEGYFAMQHKNDRDDMLLFLNHGVFYEFIPTEKYLQHDYSIAHTIDDVEVGVDYVILITSEAGLRRYVLGDTVMFTGKNPYTIKITGRTKYFLDVVGECTPLAPIEKALFETAQQYSLSICDFCVGPSSIQTNGKRSYKIIAEFSPHTIISSQEREKFADTFDKKLCDYRGYYKDERHDTQALNAPIIQPVPSYTFYKRLEKKGKLGGQHKVPKTSTTGEILDELLEIANN